MWVFSSPRLEAITTAGGSESHPKGNVNTLMVDGSATTRDWIFSKTEIPIPGPTDGTNPSLFPPNVQMFWYGHTPDSTGH